MFEHLLETGKIQSFKYREDLYTFDIEIKPVIGASYVLRFDQNNFPNHASFKILDESVQVYEDVKVLLKTEAELKANGWLETKGKKRLKSKTAPFIIGDKKKLLLGRLHLAKIGITEDFKPIIFFNGYRFSPDEIKCILKSNYISSVPTLIKKPISFTEAVVGGGYFQYDAASGYLNVLNNTLNKGHVDQLVKFLRKTNLA